MLLSLALVLMLVPYAYAQPINISANATWTGVNAIFPPFASNKSRLNYADGSVVYLGNGTYRMYFSNFTENASSYNSQPTYGEVDSATTRNGVDWILDKGARVVNRDNACPPYQGSTFMMSNGTYRMYSGCGIFQSKDGLNFTRMQTFENIPMPSGALHADGPPQITLLENGTYKAYQSFVFGNVNNNPITQILSFSSKDGFNFTQDPWVLVNETPRFGEFLINGASHPLVYQLANGSWIMYYDSFTVQYVNARQGVPPENPTVVAVSKNGINWTNVNFAVEGSETYGVIPNGNSSILIFGYYGQPQFPLPYYSSHYGGGLYYAKIGTAHVATVNNTVSGSNTQYPNYTQTSTRQTGSQSGNQQAGLILAIIVILVILGAAFYVIRRK